MKYPIILLFLILSYCSFAQPSYFIPPTDGVLNVRAWGAFGDGVHDDYPAIQSACNFCILNPAVCTKVRFPIGHYRCSHSIILQNLKNKLYDYFTIELTGDVSNKSASDGYLSYIDYTDTAGFAIGIQRGRGVVIKNLTIAGRYHFPNWVNNYNIGTLKFSDWAQPGISDSRFNPYAGISIDPYENPDGSNGGSSDINIEECSVGQFMVGVMLTANKSTQNCEMIQIINDQIQSCRVAVALGQDQSKTISITGLKSWAPVHTMVDGVTYGQGGAPCSVFCDNWNIASFHNELFNLNAGRFPLSASRIYAEGLFRIGYVYGAAGCNFHDFQVDLLTGAGMPEADYIFAGGPMTWEGGMLRYYDGQTGHRMNLSQQLAVYKDVTFTAPPMVIGFYAYGINGHPTPIFQNVNMYYLNARMKQYFEDVVAFPYVPSLKINSNWTASFIRPHGFTLNTGDYIESSPTDQTGHFYDQGLNSGQASTISWGRITSIIGDSVNLDCIPINAYNGSNYGALYRDTLK